MTFLRVKWLEMDFRGDAWEKDNSNWNDFDVEFKNSDINLLWTGGWTDPGRAEDPEMFVVKNSQGGMK